MIITLTPNKDYQDQNQIYLLMHELTNHKVARHRLIKIYITQEASQLKIRKCGELKYKRKLVLSLKYEANKQLKCRLQIEEEAL